MWLGRSGFGVCFLRRAIASRTSAVAWRSAALLCALLASGMDRAFSQSKDSAEALVKQGFALHQQARFAEAIPVLERARTKEPEDYFANLLLGIDRLRTGDPKAALPRLEQAARARPTEAIPEEYLGEAEARLGDFARAATAYQSGVARDKGSEESLEAWAGFALERFHDIGAALRASDLGVAAVKRLQAAAQEGTALRCEGPIPQLERVLALHRTGKGGVGTVADAAGQGQRRTGAEARLTAQDLHLYVETARRLSICYSVEAGKAAARLQSSGRDAGAISRLQGDVLLRLKGDASGAEEQYRRALSLRPGDPALLERLAEAQLAAGDTEKARESAEAALKVDPHRPGAMRTLASIAMDGRDYEHALPWLRELVREGPGDIKARIELGRALAQTGDAQGALDYLRPALEAGYPDEKGALHAAEARVLRQLGRDEEAARASAEARRRSDTFQAADKEGGKENVHAD